MLVYRLSTPDAEELTAELLSQAATVPVYIAWDGGLKVKVGQGGSWSPPLGQPAPEYRDGPKDPSQARVQAAVAHARQASQAVDDEGYAEALAVALDEALFLLGEFGVEVAR